MAKIVKLGKDDENKSLINDFWAHFKEKIVKKSSKKR
jgi:hypothetical protein